MTQEAAGTRPETKTAKRQVPRGLKFAVELGPLILFFAINAKWGIFTATATLMLVVPISLGVAWKLAGRMPVMPMVTAALVIVFGGLTLLLNDEEFIKIKVTILYALFGAALLIALRFNRLLLPIVFDAAIHLDDNGWRKLTWRWSFFFFFLAGLNEVLRHALSTDQWVSFKVFGIVALTFVFVLTQAPLMLRHEIKPEDDTSETHF
ncbi:septation protein A [Methylocystis bryophila]|uniref:Inner membrane-spanning protein YciB n=1 Tax=Methylocystis bryophila TaxID=655015 RepID=A0A1W6MZV0_9HYPH|nr:septation protein A [Methylocystis bryophila]ARN83095.1 septation protein A [Methylocystis bryophila]BDV39412.1 putative intracellular septation protein A [Methylocystis bryophila]